MIFEQQLTRILESLQKDHLHQGIWPDGHNLNRHVKSKLIDIASDFIEEHEIPSDSITDIIITGSMANYNWTGYSDIDLHVLVDYSVIEKCADILTDYYKIAKSEWNNQHRIQIFDHEVEIYVQDSEEPHHSTGVYSLMTDKWLIKPKKNMQVTKPSTQAVQRKLDKIMYSINAINADDKDAEVQADAIMQKIRDMRMEGLRSSGEYSLENIVFKRLRNNGYLDKLKSVGIKAYDHHMSIDTNDER